MASLRCFSLKQDINTVEQLSSSLHENFISAKQTLLSLNTISSKDETELYILIVTLQTLAYKVDALFNEYAQKYIPTECSRLLLLKNYLDGILDIPTNQPTLPSEENASTEHIRALVVFIEKIKSLIESHTFENIHTFENQKMPGLFIDLTYLCKDIIKYYKRNTSL